MAATRGRVSVTFCKAPGLQLPMLTAPDQYSVYSLEFGGPKSKAMRFTATGIEEAVSFGIGAFLSSVVKVPYKAMHRIKVGTDVFFESEELLAYEALEEELLTELDWASEVETNKAAKKAGLRVFRGGGVTSPPAAPRLRLIPGGKLADPPPLGGPKVPDKLTALFSYWTQNLKGKGKGNL